MKHAPRILATAAALALLLVGGRADADDEATPESWYETAIAAARDLEREIPEEFVKQLAFLIEGIMPTTLHVMIRFGKWEEILREPRPADWRLVSIAVWHYARSIAYSALGQTDSARAEIARFDEASASIPPTPPQRDRWGEGTTQGGASK